MFQARVAHGPLRVGMTRFQSTSDAATSTVTKTAAGIRNTALPKTFSRTACAPMMTITTQPTATERRSAAARNRNRGWRSTGGCSGRGCESTVLFRLDGPLIAVSRRSRASRHVEPTQFPMAAVRDQCSRSGLTNHSTVFSEAVPLALSSSETISKWL